MKMRSNEEIEAMLKRVDDLRETEAYEDDEFLECVQHVLLWVTDTYNPDTYLTDYFPEFK